MTTPSIVNGHWPQYPYAIIPGRTERYSALSTAQGGVSKIMNWNFVPRTGGRGGGSVNCFRRRVFSAYALVGKTQAAAEKTRLTSSVLWSFSPSGRYFVFHAYRTPNANTSTKIAPRVLALTIHIVFLLAFHTLLPVLTTPVQLSAVT